MGTNLTLSAVVEYVNESGVELKYQNEGNKLVWYINGEKATRGGKDPSGIVTELKIGFMGDGVVLDQYGWGGRVPDDKIESLKALAISLNVPWIINN
jgi:hypothetical protein